MTPQPFSETVTDIRPPSRYTIRHECITPHHIGARADNAGEGRPAPRRVFDGVLTAGRDPPGKGKMAGAVDGDRSACARAKAGGLSAGVTPPERLFPSSRCLGRIAD